MAISPKDVLNKNKNLNKRVEVEKINLENVTIDDLKFNGKNYDEFINLQSLHYMHQKSGMLIYFQAMTVNL